MRVSNRLPAGLEKTLQPKIILTFTGSGYRLFCGTMIVLALSGCSSRVAPPEARYVPAGDLLDIVKDFQRLAKEDTYRFSIPKDVTGINIMKATLVRLNDYERKNPNQFTDIVQFNKALCLERLARIRSSRGALPKSR